MKGLTKAGNGGGVAGAVGKPGLWGQIKGSVKDYAKDGWEENAKRGAAQADNSPARAVPTLGTGGIIQRQPINQNPIRMPQEFGGGGASFGGGGMFRGGDNPMLMQSQWDQPQFGGFYADGGRAPAGKRIIVGEEGPEEIILDTPGTVIPTDDLHGDMTAAEKYRGSAPIGQGQPQPVEQAVAPVVGNPQQPSPAPSSGMMFRGRVPSRQEYKENITPPNPNAMSVDPRYTRPVGGEASSGAPLSPYAAGGPINRPVVDAASGGLSTGNVEQPQLSASERTQQRISNLDDPNAPPDRELKHEGSGFKRFFKGLFRGWQNWNGEGGLLGGLAAAASSGVSAASSADRDLNQQKTSIKNKLFRERAYQMKEEDFANKQNTEQAKAANDINQIQNRNLNTQLSILDKDQDLLWKTAYGRGDADFDPKDPANADLVARMRAKGVPVVTKRKGQKFQAVTGQNGEILAFDPETGKAESLGNYAKTAPLTDKDLPDSLVGLMTDDELSDKAKASVGKLPEGRRVRSDIAAKLPEKYKTNGVFDEDKYWKARSTGDVEVAPGDLYENLPSDYDQRLAKFRDGARGSQKELREQWTRFKTGISNNRPDADAVPATILEVVDLFKKVMALPPKERAAGFSNLYAKLPKMKLQTN